MIKIRKIIKLKNLSHRLQFKMKKSISMQQPELKKSARFAGTFSSRASLASLSTPRARDLIVALRAPIFLDLVLRARSCALRIRLSLFLII